MDHRRKPALVRVPPALKVGMHSGQLRVQPFKERKGLRRVGGMHVDLKRGCGVQRRLSNARGLDARWRSLRAVDLPEVRTWEIAAWRDCGIEHDVRQHAVGPLRVKQRLKLGLRACLVVPGAADRDERGVPAPLVRIQTGRGHRRVADPVVVEHRFGSFLELGSLGPGELAGMGFSHWKPPALTNAMSVGRMTRTAFRLVAALTDIKMYISDAAGATIRFQPRVSSICRRLAAPALSYPGGVGRAEISVSRLPEITGSTASTASASELMSSGASSCSPASV